MLKKCSTNIDDGILYIMRFDIEGEMVYKVGLTTRRPAKRLMEILMSFYKVYRYSPRADIKRFRKVTSLRAKEAALLASLKEYKYTAKKKFSGCTEMIVGIDEDVLLDMYKQCIAGKELDTLVNPAIKKESK